MLNLLEIISSKKVIIPDSYEQFKTIVRILRGKQGSLSGLKIKQEKPDKIFENSEDFFLSSPDKGFLPGDILGELSPIWLQLGDSEHETRIRKSQPAKFMIVSTECDCELREDGSHMSYIRVCPVYDEQEVYGLMTTGNPDQQLMGDLRSNSIVEYFWIPRMEKNGNGHFADISHIVSIHTESLHRLAKSGKIKRMCSLSETAFFLLQLKLAWFFSRPGPSDSQRDRLEPFRFES